jgi:outer membrane protein W
VALVAGFIAAPVASAQQSLDLYIGGTRVRAEDARDSNDVLVRDRTFMDFNVGDFNGATIGGEWLVGMGDMLDAGLGLGFYQRTVTAVDSFSAFQGTNAPIAADLKLRVVPFTATIRFLPLGHRAGIQPYLGAGVGVFAWRYSETGNFVASDDVTIVRGNFVGSGSKAGPVVLGGLRVPMGSMAVGGEVRYQSAVADLPSDKGFAGSKIDLGGFNYLLTFNIRF